MIAALYVQKGGVYYGLPNVDPWDETRDARKYKGPYSVVAHPPCNRWCQPLAWVNQTRYGHKVGEDGGCFFDALDSILTWGGVLEHPANTYAWKQFKLLKPTQGTWTQDGACWVTQVAQSAYGHKAKKLTWLYYHGDVRPPDLDWSVPKATHTISWMGESKLKPLSKKEAIRTPDKFRDMLIALAEGAIQ